ncbi:hypothetical protein [Cohnella thermotolerans]|uniref:hypothetical protein n=1 Tax=Cohnella thermotolerans TaxID=329858 RepID=UPI00040BA652|nr:hypothetical protein [Cohnella thermotolerans]
MNKKWKFALTGALAVALLSGCGAKSDDNAAAQNNQSQGAARSGQAGQSGQGGMRGGMGMVDEDGNTADLLGKIKSISGQTITVYKSSFDPSQMRGGQGGSGGQGGQDGQGGQSPSGAPASNAPDADRQGGNSGNRPQGMGNMFTDQTVDITVTDATKIETTSFENGQRTTKEIALSDLKADDVLTIWLKEGTQEAETIRAGGFGGGRGARQGQQQDGQASGQASSSNAQASASNG